MKRRRTFLLLLTLYTASSSGGFLLPHHHSDFRSTRSTRSSSFSVGSSFLRRHHYYHIHHYASLGVADDDEDTTTKERYYKKYVVSSEELRRRNTNNKPQPTSSQSSSGARRKFQIATKFKALTELEERQDLFFWALAVLPSLIAFVAWKDIGLALSKFLETYGVAAQDIDGEFANNLLRPTITGVVVPVIAIALATLVSTTINVLRDREVQLRTLINKESCDLYLLRQAVFGLFGTKQHSRRRKRALQLMASYVRQLERESSLGAVPELQNLQLSGGIAGTSELNSLTQMLHGIDGAAASRQGSVSYADDLIRSLNDYRSERVAELLSGFPAIHWGVLILLSISIQATFLLASNQPQNEYLNSLSLRYLFATLVGVTSGTATICINLADPFRGTFSVLDASAQLSELRLVLEQDIKEAIQESDEIKSSSSSLVHAFLFSSGEQEQQQANNNERSRIPTTTKSTAVVDNNPAADDDLMKLYDDDDWKKLPVVVGEDDSEDNLQQPKRAAKSSKQQPQQRRRRQRGRGYYGLVPTMYFHLLTGPFGSNAKALGEIIVWLSTFLTSQTKILSRQVLAISIALDKQRRKWWLWWLRRRQRRTNLPTSSPGNNNNEEPNPAAVLKTSQQH